MMALEPETCVCTALRQASRRVSQHYDAALGPVGVTSNQYAILVRLDRFGASTVQALATLLVMDRSTLGHLLRPLEARGLVRIGTDPADRRRREIVLTADGRALVAEARPHWQAAQTAFEAAYGAEEARRLRTALRRVSGIEAGALPAAAALTSWTETA